MKRNSGRMKKVVTDRHESHFETGEKPAESLGFSRDCRGHSYPRHCPHPDDAPESVNGSPLGEPMMIDDVATLLGCSTWTIRQKYLPEGLPYLRASATGKFIFFRGQIVNWILERQEKGGGK
jgi:hypothetical protein